MMKSGIIFCNGPSMKPTVMPGDVIEIEEVAFDEIRPGNVIVYNCPENIRLNIIHRVIGLDAAGLITRGDNNSAIDPYRVRPEHFPRKVVAVTRQNKRIPMSDWGMLQHRLRLLQRRWRFFARRVLFPVYATIADAGFLFPAGFFLKTEIHGFKCGGDVEQQLFWRGKRIGIFDRDRAKWQIRFPWRFFIKPPKIEP